MSILSICLVVRRKLKYGFQGLNNKFILQNFACGKIDHFVKSIIHGYAKVFRIKANEVYHMCFFFFNLFMIYSYVFCLSFIFAFENDTHRSYMEMAVVVSSCYAAKLIPYDVSHMLDVITA